MAAPILEMHGIYKRFPGVQALSDVSLKLEIGEILAVVGENGAGKSTLMNILGGIYQPDDGEILYNGRKVAINSTQSALELGIGVIHQELNLIDNLDIASNIFLGHEPFRMGLLRLIDRDQIYRGAEKILKRLGMRSSSRTLVMNLPLGQQQLVEIAKALSINVCVLVMDEPSSSLSTNEVSHLFDVIKELKTQGVSIIYVSHRLGEVEKIADRVLVLRDGFTSGNLEKHEIAYDTMVRMMVGRSFDKFYHRVQSKNVPVLEIEGLRTASNPRHEINLSLQAGEILTLSGLVGAGRTELLHAIFGIDRPLAGQILVGGKPVDISSPRDAIRAGIGLVPEDRRLQGLILEMMVEENITLAGLDKFQWMKIVRRDMTKSITEEMVEKLGIRTPGIFQEVYLLSGGNQQKVVLAKWILLRPKVLLLDEPTRGIDVVAKEEIYRLMENLTTAGVGILMATSEMQEVLRISDRIVAMHEGCLNGELSEEQFSEEAVVNLITGGK
jgi:ribose transport system ATP-binding protein